MTQSNRHIIVTSYKCDMQFADAGDNQVLQWVHFVLCCGNKPWPAASVQSENTTSRQTAIRQLTFSTHL